MKPLKMRLNYVLAGSLAFCAVPFAHAEVKSNPYQSITERNPFGLKPPPPPPDPTPVVPVIPPGKVALTGILTMFGPPRAIFEITETEAGKAGAIRKPPAMREGERDGAVEVLSIDIEKSMVKIRNAGIETNVTFDIAKLTPSAPATLPGGAAIPHLGGATPNPMSPANAAANNSGRGSGVTVSGASTGAPSYGRGAGAGAYGAGTPYGGAANPAYGSGTTYGGAANAAYDGSGLRSIPSRAVRSDGLDPSVPINPAVQYENMQRQKENANNLGLPHPPLPPAFGGGPPLPSGHN